MASQVPPKKNAGFTCYVALPSQADVNLLQSNPTLATGDVKVSIDGGAFNNLGTLPDVDPNSGVAVKVVLSADEMNGDNIQVLFHDAAGAEWADLFLNIQTVARQQDDLAFPNTAGRGIDVTTGGGVGIDWSNVENPTTSLNLSGTSVGTATALGTQAKADVNAEMVDVLVTDTFAEPSGVPAYPLSIKDMTSRVAAALIHGLTVNSNTNKLQFKNAAGTVIWEKDLTNAAGVYTETAGNAP